MLRIFLTLLIVSSALTQVRKCPKYCEDCDANGKCHSCLKSKLTNQGTCEEAIAPGNCLLHGEYNRCELCEPGYSVIYRQALGEDGLMQRRRDCDVNKIANCELSFEFPDESTVGLGQAPKLVQICAACNGGYPTLGNKACGGFTQNGLEQRKNNCLWGGRGYKETKTFCYRCKAGYAVKDQTGECVPYTKEGCIAEDKNQGCLFCNVFDGYYKATPSTCTQ